jgi:hypothetical protein
MIRLILAGLILLAVCPVSAQVRWSAPTDRYPNQWTPSSPPPPIYERNAGPNPRAPREYVHQYPNPEPASSRPALEEEKIGPDAEKRRAGLFSFPKPFSGNPFWRNWFRN